MANTEEYALDRAFLISSVSLPWTTKKKNTLIIEEINAKFTLKAEIILLCTCYVKTQPSLKKAVVLGKVKGKRSRLTARWMDSQW